MSDTPSLPEGYEISADPGRIDRERVHHWLSTDAYWALGRTREKQDRAIEGSLNFGVYETVSGEQVAYARVITDRATFAWLCDVYVDPSVRGKSVGSALVAAVRDEMRQYGGAARSPRHARRARGLREAGVRAAGTARGLDGAHLRPVRAGAPWVTRR